MATVLWNQMSESGGATQFSDGTGYSVNGAGEVTSTWFNASVAVSSPGPAATATSTGVNPVETSYSLYGHTIPLSVLGVARIGGEIIAGPWIENGNASFCISFGVPADPTGTRTLREIAFDSEVVWDWVNGFYTESFTFREYGGTLTQAADPLEIAYFGADAVAYRPQMLIWFEDLPLANTKFKKIPYVAAIWGDSVSDDVNLGEAFERLAYSPWVGWTSAEFETSGITDGLVSGGLIFAEPSEFLGTIQQFGRFYRSWDILQTDKLRISDRGATVTADITLDKSTLMDAVVLTRQEPNSVPSILELSTIDQDADYTIVPSRAQRPRAPVAVTTSVKTESAYLPAIMDSSTRTSLVTYAKYQEEHARKKIQFTAMAHGLEIEPGDLVAITGLGDDFQDETFKVVETLHGVNYSVECVAESILKCTVAVSSGGSSPGATAQWAVSRSRVLVPGYAGAFDSIVSGAVDIWYDQSGNARDLTAISSTARPIATTSGPNSRECADFSPASISAGHAMDTDAGDPISDIMSASTGYIVVSIRPDAVSQNSSSPHLNAATLCWTDSWGVAGLTVRSGGQLYAYNDDGSVGGVNQFGGLPTSAASAASAVPIGGDPCVIEWRHEGGTIYQRINGANETSVTSGNTRDMTGVLRMGFGGVTGTFFNGKIFEAMIYSTVPTQAERDAIVLDMMTWVGA
jgi:hypothetical protein